MIDTSEQKPDAQEAIPATPEGEPIPQHPPKSPLLGRKNILTSMLMEDIVAALNSVDWDKTAASTILGVTRQALHKFMKIEGMKKPKAPTLREIRDHVHAENKMRITMRNKYAPKGMGKTGMGIQNHPPGTPGETEATPSPPSPLITAEVIQGICLYMLEHECGLLPACRELGYKAARVHYFLSKHGNEGLYEEFRRVRVALIDMSVDQMDEVAEDCDPINYNAQRVKLLAMQWKAQALRPDLYGGFKKTDDRRPIGGGGNLSDDELDVKIKHALSRLDILMGRTPTPKAIEAPAEADGSGSVTARNLE